MELRPLSPALGVEVVGVDLTRDVEPDVIAAIVDAFREHYLVLVRTPGLDDEQYYRFASWFGPIEADGYREGTRGTLPSYYISNTRPEGVAREGSLLKHQDYCFTDTFLCALALYAEAVPSAGGQTVFANAHLAYDNLSTPQRDRIHPLRARHCYDTSNDYGNRRFRLAASPGAKNAAHPVALPHPHSGRPILFVNELMTDSIEGLAEDESEALLGELLAVLDDPAIGYEHTWQVGDVIVWDNMALQHGRRPFAEGDTRSLRRIQLSCAF